MENKLFELGYKFVPYTISRSIFNQERNPCYIKMKWEEKIEKYIVLNEEKTKIVDSGIVIGRFLNQQLVPLNEEEFNQVKKVMKDLKKELLCETNEECIEVIGNELHDRGVCEKYD